MAILNRDELLAMGFKSLGVNVSISKKCSIYGADRISISNNVRIDDFCVLSAGVHGIYIGSYVHIGVYSSLIGAGEIQLNDYCNISSRVSIYSSNDDYSGEFMTSPMIPTEYTNVTTKPVKIGKHSIVGSGTVILPGVTMQDGVAIGSLSLVKENCAAFCIYAGNPLKFIKSRKENILELERRFLSDLEGNVL